MKVFIISINLKIHNECFTSLKAACKHAGVSYGSASHGKLIFISDPIKQDIITITPVEVIRIKGRSGNMPNDKRGGINRNPKSE